MSKYMLSSPEDMIRLARHVQSRVYWGETFQMKDDPEENIYYSDFWDIIEVMYSQSPFIGVIVNKTKLANSDEITLLYKEGE